MDISTDELADDMLPRTEWVMIRLNGVRELVLWVNSEKRPEGSVEWFSQHGEQCRVVLGKTVGPYRGGWLMMADRGQISVLASIPQPLAA